MSDIFEEVTNGYTPIAIRDDRSGNTVVSHNPIEGKYLVSVSGKLSGPYTMRELEVLKDNVQDVLDMKGLPPHYLKDYDIYGRQQ